MNCRNGEKFIAARKTGGIPSSGVHAPESMTTGKTVMIAYHRRRGEQQAGHGHHGEQFGEGMEPGFVDLGVVPDARLVLDHGPC
jgi:hypothetical protein